MDIVIEGLVRQFQRDRDLTDLKLEEAFETFAGFCVLSSFYEDEFSPDVFRTGGGNDLGIDFFGILINGELLHDEAEVRAATEQARQLDVRIVLGQAKTTAGFEGKVLSDLADNLHHLFGEAPPPYPISPDVENIRGCLRAIFANIGKFTGKLPKLHIRYITTGSQVAKLVAEKARSAERLLSRAELFDQVDVCCVTQRELRGLYHRATQAVSVTFDMVKKLSPPTMPGVVQSVFGLVPARRLVEQVLTDPTGNIRKALFHENVRDFQGYNAVNTQIRDTLRDPVRRERFAVLNNGITIVGRELTVVGDRIQIRDFQIVNGCQTCHVLFHERDQLTDETQVSVRIVHSEDEDVIAGIIAATNRQTAVSEEELSSREDFHMELEDFFAAQEPAHRLYYERRSKQYSARQEFDKARVVNRAQLTRAYAAIVLGEPSTVGHYRSLTDRHRAQLFQPGGHREVYYAAAVTHYRVEWLFRTRRIPARLRPARFHLMAAVKRQLLGDGRPPNAPKQARDWARKLTEVMWPEGAAERLVVGLLPAITRAIEIEERAGVPLGEMVRNRRFAELVRQQAGHD
ncbi:AIPR family protein [Solwaraspora sp. WMMD1047]|uniref:AIPR family protein n=1 Tax=Solwaraspora sp. WMMD1047 TaxID=3016102 RepID=UPI002416E29D|nr:AIPR family protein [Solwaraspora sp. WMMD1047]MDG4833634.1 AIPR family protein [Solwaraspora sp. WMMD1047]